MAAERTNSYRVAKCHPIPMNCGATGAGLRVLTLILQKHLQKVDTDKHAPSSTYTEMHVHGQHTHTHTQLSHIGVKESATSNFRSQSSDNGTREGMSGVS